MHWTRSSCRLFKAAPTTLCVCREQQLETGLSNKRLKHTLELLLHCSGLAEPRLLRTAVPHTAAVVWTGTTGTRPAHNSQAPGPLLYICPCPGSSSCSACRRVALPLCPLHPDPLPKPVPLCPTPLNPTPPAPVLPTCLSCVCSKVKTRERGKTWNHSHTLIMNHGPVGGTTPTWF